jgi:hypothetical protein
MVGNKVPLVTNINGRTEIIGTATVINSVPKNEVDIEKIDSNVESYTVENLNLPE